MLTWSSRPEYASLQKTLADGYTAKNKIDYQINEEGLVLTPEMKMRLDSRISFNEENLREALDNLVSKGKISKFSDMNYRSIRSKLERYKDEYDNCKSYGNDINMVAKQYGCAQALWFVMKKVGWNHLAAGGGKKTRKSKRYSKKSKKCRTRS